MNRLLATLALLATLGVFWTWRDVHAQRQVAQARNEAVRQERSQPALARSPETASPVQIAETNIPVKAAADDPKTVVNARAKAQVDPFTPGLFQDDAYIELAKKYFEGVIEDRYTALFSRLGLQPDAEMRLKAILVELQLIEFDIKNAMASPGDPLAGATVDRARLYARYRAEALAKVKDQLGPEVLSALQTHAIQTPVRQLIDTFALRLSYAEPLTAAQRAQLMETWSAKEHGPLSSADGLLDPALESARQVLTPSQLSSLREIGEERAAGRQLAELERKIRKGGGK